MCKIILLTGSIVGYAYMMEFFIAWYWRQPVRDGRLLHPDRRRPVTAWAYFAMMFCNVIAPAVFWFKSCRQNLWVVMIVCMFVNIGMWFERFVIIVTTLARMWLPGDWQY